MFYSTNMKPYEKKLLNDEDSVQAFEKNALTSSFCVQT